MGTTTFSEKLFAFFGLLLVLSLPLSAMGMVSWWLGVALVAVCAAAVVAVVMTSPYER
jgi:hypothetical protein